MSFSQLENKIGYVFKNKEYLKNAMCHSSYANEHYKDKRLCNERLEFLGDSILGFITARYLYKKYPHKPEGELTKIRAAKVCESALCTYAVQIGMGDALLLGHGEELGGGRQRPSLLADAFEALLAAMYLDGGLQPVEKFLLPFISEDVTDNHQDYKTELQELVQQHPGKEIRYMITDIKGPDHEREYSASVSLDDQVIGTGCGKSKKEAEQMAAQSALKRMNTNEKR